MLLPIIIARATRAEIYVLLPGAFAVQLWGLQTTQWLARSETGHGLAAIIRHQPCRRGAAVVLLVMVWRILRRDDTAPA